MVCIVNVDSVVNVASGDDHVAMFHYVFLTPTFQSSIAPHIGGLLLASALALLLMRRTAWEWGNNRFFEQQSGQAVIEFLLVMPLLLCVLLVIFQIALLVQAKFVVNYAAFCAVRSAVVVIPEGVKSNVTGKSEAPGEIHGDDPTYPKLAQIRRAASLASASISPSGSLGLNSETSLQASGRQNLPLALTVFGRNQTLQFVRRAPYALSSEVTTVTVAKTPSPPNAAGDFSLITVHLTYRYFLTVPFADRLFGKAFSGNLLTGSGYYVEINEQYTLPMENENIFPQSLQGKQQYLTEEYN